MANIKIFVTQRIDKESVLIENDILTPIRCGAVYDDSKSEIIGDNTGDNISEKRLSYCELTTQYWAWKNVKTDYYGFCHYRRYFSFNNKKLEADDWSNIIRPYLNKKTIAEMYLDDEARIENTLEGYDVITPVPIDLKKVNCSSVYDQYKMGAKLYIKDLDILLEVLKDSFPDYYDDAKQYFAGTTLYLCNMFIMKRDVFYKYSQWLFDVLAAFEKRADMSLYSEEGLRTPGHLAERLFGVYFHYLQSHTDCKFRELQMLTVADASSIKKMSPAFNNEDTVNIVFSCTEYYAPYCAATIQSILDTANMNRNYDFVILEKDIPPKTKALVCSLADGCRNISIRFLNVSQKFSEYNLSIREHFAVETYFRLAISDLLPDYDKVLYLDSDLIVMDDISTLYDTDITDYCFAGVADTVLTGHINGFSTEKHKKYYTQKSKLKKQNLLHQINAGVLLMNLTKIKELYNSDEMLEYAQLGNFDLCDQDVINSLFQDHIYLLPQEWNAAADEEGTLRPYVASFAPAEMYKKYKVAILEPKIMHYLGTIKPWNEPAYENAYLFWEVLRKTPFYEIVLHRRIVENAHHYASHYSAAALLPVGLPPTKKPLQRKIIDKLFPMESRRRNFIKKLYCKLVGKL